MFDYIERLRQKPEAERRKVALIVSVGITLVIFVVWSVMTWSRIKNTDFSPPVATSTAPAANIPSLSETFSNFMDEMRSIIGSQPSSTPTQ